MLATGVGDANVVTGGYISATAQGFGGIKTFTGGLSSAGIFTATTSIFTSRVNFSSLAFASSSYSFATATPTSTILGTTGSSPVGIAIDSQGNIYTANQNSNTEGSNYSLVKIELVLNLSSI